MGLIKEPLDVDFYFEERQMNSDDQRRVSEYIANGKKEKRASPKGINYAVQDEPLIPFREDTEKYVVKKTQ